MATDERIEAYVLYIKDEGLLALRSFVEDQGARLEELLSRLPQEGLKALRISKVHPAEIPADRLRNLGFRPAGQDLLYSAVARSA